MSGFTCSGVYSGSGPLVQWPGSGYCPSGAREDCQGGLEERTIHHYITRSSTTSLLLTLH